MQSADLGWQASAVQNSNADHEPLAKSSGIADQLSAQLMALSIASIQSTAVITNAAKKSLHLGDLPGEVIAKIVEHVVLPDLDMTSLERLGMACKAMFLYARDPLIWRLACQRVWGPQCTPSDYSGSWRQMYINRPRPRFDGVYVSKNTYVRAGEKELNTFYAPCHVVEYVRKNNEWRELII